MNQDNNSVQAQLVELTAKLCSEVAEKLAHWSRDMEPNERQRILRMIEEDLPTVVTNTVGKSAMLHSDAGIKYLSENLESWSTSFARKFIGKD